MDLGDVSSLLSGGCSQESHCTSQHLASSSGSWFSSSPAGRKEAGGGVSATLRIRLRRERTLVRASCGMGTPENQNTQTPRGTGPQHVCEPAHTSKVSSGLPKSCSQRFNIPTLL